MWGILKAACRTSCLNCLISLQGGGTAQGDAALAAFCNVCALLWWLQQKVYALKQTKLVELETKPLRLHDFLRHQGDVRKWVAK